MGHDLGHNDLFLIRFNGIEWDTTHPFIESHWGLFIALGLPHPPESIGGFVESCYPRPASTLNKDRQTSRVVN